MYPRNGCAVGEEALDDALYEFIIALPELVITSPAALPMATITSSGSFLTMTPCSATSCSSALACFVVYSVHTGL